MDDFSDYREIFGRDPEPWRVPLGALRLTLAVDDVNIQRARDECEELVRVLNTSDPVAKVEEHFDYTLTELADSQERISEWIGKNIHKSYGCIGCDICTMRAVLELTGDVLRVLAGQDENNG